MNSQLRSALATYARAFIASVITGMIALNISPLTMTRQDLLALSNAVWVSFLPVLMRALNAKDTAYGVGSSDS